MTSSMVSRLVMTLARGAGHYHTTDKLLQRLQLSSAALAASYTSSAVEDIADARLIVNSLVEVLKCQTDNTRAVPKVTPFPLVPDPRLSHNIKSFHQYYIVFSFNIFCWLLALCRFTLLSFYRVFLLAVSYCLHLETI